ncbi:hypothetical protein [Oryza sativa Japonica Group]|uniref:Uncharacterized protein n=1 Tax=Oryza sativa subsp. japonica TaxID=39947 RepID=Q5N7K9_ORYSJ|nr:hypothetical protein [Oryza sativa Japonica Group]
MYPTDERHRTRRSAEARRVGVGRRGLTGGAVLITRNSCIVSPCCPLPYPGRQAAARRLHLCRTAEAFGSQKRSARHGHQHQVRACRGDGCDVETARHAQSRRMSKGRVETVLRQIDRSSAFAT